MYGVLERQFRNYYAGGARKGATGENLLKLLECRLDNVVYRMGFASTRAEARQLVSHKADRSERQASSTIASYQVQGRRRGAVREKSKQAAAHPGRAGARDQVGFPEWVEVNDKEMRACSRPCRRARMSAGHQREPGRRVVFEVIGRHPPATDPEDYLQCSISFSKFLKPRVVKVQPVAPRQARCHRAVRARLRPHAGQRAAARAAVVDARLRADHRGEIDGVLHEYTSIDGVQEDVVDILLNLKGVALRMHNRDEVPSCAAQEGPEGPVTAGDIQTDHDVEIINPEHVIAT
jgi:hypothetical protein